MEEHSERVAEEKRERPPQGPPPLQLTSDDTEIFRLVHEYRLLTRDHLAVLTKRHPKRLHRRLLKLLEHRYLKRRVPAGQKHIYSIGREGLSILLDEDLIGEAEAQRRLREHELKDSRVPHEMMIADIHAMLDIASRPSPVKLCLWQQGKELSHTILWQGEKITVEPDAFFALEDTRQPAGANRAYFLLEVDRSTEAKVRREGSRRFHDKFYKYVRYIQAGAHTEKYGKKNMRIVTITKTAARRDSLTEDAHQAELVPENMRKFFLFGSQTDFSLENPSPILAAVFLQPGRREPRPLVKTAEV